MKILLNKTFTLFITVSLFLPPQVYGQLCLQNCVWAGDADRDSIVTTYDILQVGLAQGESGSPRNTPLNWAPYDSEDWANTINGIDLKHADCDGNGIVNLDDFAYPKLFFGNSYKVDELPADQYNYGNELCVISHNEYTLDHLASGATGRARIRIGEAYNIYGLAFTLEYDTDYLSLTFFSGFDLWENNTNTFTITQHIPEHGELHLASVRTNGINGVTDEGWILNHLFFKSIPIDFAQVQTLIRIKNIKAILNNGAVLDYGSKDLLVEIYNPDGNGQILSNENLEEQKIQIFPNPTSHFLNIKTENFASKNLIAFDINGKTVLEKTSFSNSDFQLPIEHLTNGIYFLKIEIEGKFFIKKFIKIGG